MALAIPTISWEALISQVTPDSTQYQYSCKVTKVNVNDPGYGQLAVGYYIVDYIGHIFEIKSLDFGGDPTGVVVLDLLSDPYSYGPYNDKNAYVYDSLTKAALAAQAKLGRLDQSAEDFVQSLTMTPNQEGFKVYSGFVNRTDSNISILAGTFTIAPAVTDYTVYTDGTKHVINSTQTVSITADQTITYIYIDTNGILQKSTSIWDIEGGEAPCAIIFKDGAEYAITDERHGYDRNRPWHKWAHNNIGAMYRSGLTGTFTNTTLSVTQGVIADEDLNHDTGGTKTTCSLWYRNATTGMRMIRNSSTPYYNPGTLKYDNGSGTLQDVSANRYSSQWVYATGDTVNPIYVVIGQDNNANLADSRNSTAPVINLSTAEWKLIYKVIYRRSGADALFVEAIDYRTVQTGVPTASNITNHSSLTGRDVANSHPASAISYDNSTEILSDVQTELTNLINKTLRQTIFTYTV